MQAPACPSAPPPLATEPARSDDAARHAIWPGLLGAGALVSLTWLAYRSRSGAVEGLLGEVLRGDRGAPALYALAVCGGVMFLAEASLCVRSQRGGYWSLDPRLRSGRFSAFAIEAVAEYAANLALLLGAQLFFEHAVQLDYLSPRSQYAPWFAVMELLVKGYLWLGLPYVLLTRALQHDPSADGKDASQLVRKPLRRLWLRVRHQPVPPELSFGAGDRTALLGALVKIFFLPLMTAMFVHFFEAAVASWRLYADTVPALAAQNSYRHERANIDAYNTALAAFLGIDVGIAWCGYLLTSRWTKNTNVSVEPTVLGWLVTLCCYPPFNTVVGTWFPLTNESSFIQLPSPWVVTAIAALALGGYALYALCTVFLGLRFSNLTHRGIVTRGPYALVRHPAYAAKCLAWWCSTLPFVLIEVARAPGFRTAFPLVGLCIQTGFYYLRAITEERHLGADPAYAEYAARVKHRFIPGVL